MQEHAHVHAHAHTHTHTHTHTWCSSRIHHNWRSWCDETGGILGRTSSSVRHCPYCGENNQLNVESLPVDVCKRPHENTAQSYKLTINLVQTPLNQMSIPTSKYISNAIHRPLYAPSPMVGCGISSTDVVAVGPFVVEVKDRVRARVSLAHVTPTSSLWSQLTSRLGHWVRLPSVPLHNRFSNKTGPVPSPKCARRCILWTPG